MYDLTSTYFEGSRSPSARFPSRAFGYSRDRRSDRPQVVIGLLCTGDGIPIAHHVFAGNTADVATLPGVLDDLATRFGVGRVCVVADRGLISADNVEILDGHGFAHVLATRLHRDPTCAAALDAAAADDAVWVEVPDSSCTACEVTVDGRRCVVVSSPERLARDTVRTAELVARTEAKLVALEWRVRDGLLTDPGKIGRAAQRILGPSGVGRLFDVEIGPGRFLYHYNDAAFAYEDAPGRPLRAHHLAHRRRGVHHPGRDRLPPAATDRSPLPGPQGLLAPASRPALHRTTRPRSHRHLRLRLHPRSPHRPRPPHRRRARPRPRPTSTSAALGPYASSAGSGPSPSTPPDAPSTSSPAAPRCRPASSAPSTSTPAPGTGPTSPDPGSTPHRPM